MKISSARLRCTLLLSALLAVIALPAWSLDKPASSPLDARIRWTNYDADNVVQIETTLGIATHIQLADDEEYVTHAFGDAAAYDFQQVGKHLLLKPIADQADTNLVYITDRRNYSFLLRYASARKEREMLRVVMRYPEMERAASDAQAEQERIEDELTRAGAAINWEHYKMSGHTAMGPVAAWDDGVQTFLRFAPGQDLPAVYAVDADGQELLVNRHMQDERTMVLQRVAPRWHLRLGKQVVAVYNEAPVAARGLSTGTVSPTVERVLRVGSQ